MPLFGRNDQQDVRTDEQAVERYRYMLRTAPPETIERAHEEAFAKLTPEQRRLALEQLTSSAPPEEARSSSDDPRSLARLATRTEMRQPGMLERLFGGAGGNRAGFGGSGFGGMLAGSLLGSVAGTFIGSAIAQSFFEDHPFDGGSEANSLSGADDTSANDSGGEPMEAGFDDPGDFGDFGGDLDI